jgi:hypothetical protein
LPKSGVTLHDQLSHTIAAMLLSNISRPIGGEVIHHEEVVDARGSMEAEVGLEDVVRIPDDEGHDDFGPTTHWHVP